MPYCTSFKSLFSEKPKQYSYHIPVSRNNMFYYNSFLNCVWTIYISFSSNKEISIRSFSSLRPDLKIDNCLRAEESFYNRPVMHDAKAGRNVPVELNARRYNLISVQLKQIVQNQVMRTFWKHGTIFRQTPKHKLHSDWKPILRKWNNVSDRNSYINSSSGIFSEGFLHTFQIPCSNILRPLDDR